MKEKLMYFLTIGIAILFITTNCQDEFPPPQYEYFTDNRDGETYKYVKIGNQFWMSENLRFKPDSGNFWAYNNIETDVEINGYLYGWEMANNVCPADWHLPSDAEWTELSDYLGGSLVAGGKMKVRGTTHWNSPNNGAKNSSGFSALPSGTYQWDTFSGRVDLTYFWSSEPRLNIWWLTSSTGHFNHQWIEMYFESASVRCVRN